MSKLRISKSDRRSGYLKEKIKTSSGDDLQEVINPNGSKYLQIPAGGGGGMVDSVNSKTGEVILNKIDIGLSNVDNTSDLEKPVSTAVQSVIDSINIFAGERYAEIQAIQTELGTISPIVENLEDIVITGDIAGRLDTIEFNITTIQGDITNILNQISDLDARVTALENPPLPN